MATIEHLSSLEGSPHANVFPDAEPKTIRLTLAEGEAVPAHTHPGRDVVFYLLEGALDLALGEESYQVSAGDIARFEGEQEIAPHATEPSTALIVLAERAAD